MWFWAGVPLTLDRLDFKQVDEKVYVTVIWQTIFIQEGYSNFAHAENIRLWNSWVPNLRLRQALFFYAIYLGDTIQLQMTISRLFFVKM